MPFGSTIVITVDGVARTLNRINQDNYGSEYLSRSSSDEYRMKIRHTKEAPQKDGRVFDRHNVELTHTLFAAAGKAAAVRQTYIISRVLTDDDVDAAGDELAAFVDFLDDGALQASLLTWQS